LPDGTKEKSAALEEVRKLYSIRREQAKDDDAYEDTKQKWLEEIEKRKVDRELREAQMDQQHREFITKTAVDVATTGAKLAVYVVVGRWVGSLETTGTLATTLGKSFVREGLNLVGLKK
jgi:hypothetical protein